MALTVDLLEIARDGIPDIQGSIVRTTSKEGVQKRVADRALGVMVGAGQGD